MISIIDKAKCCGCSSCVQRCPKQCISLKEDKEGFLYPIVDEEICIDCGLCERVCPVLHQMPKQKPLQTLAAKHPDDAIRLKSSSGGVFTLLAEQIIAKDGVVFGARFDENWNVVHDYAETSEELAAFRGSKYLQSSIGDSYKHAETFLKSGREVMFTGTPCQIAGLKKFLRKEYDNLLTVDFVCHGVPSPLVWRTYLKDIRVTLRTQCGDGKNTDSSSLNDLPVITGISFRDKTNGWEKYGFFLRAKSAIMADENSVSSSVNDRNIIYSKPFYENAFMKAFLSDLILRPSCYACPAKGGSSGADITIGDFWGIERENPTFFDDNGVSLVMTHNDKADKLLSDCEMEEMSYLSALRGNPSIENSVNIPVNRAYFWYLFNRGNAVANIMNQCQSSKFFARLRRFLFRKTVVDKL